jgi:diaminopimelate decarboxylase
VIHLVTSNTKGERVSKKQEQLFQRLEELVTQLGYEIDYANMGGLITIDNPKEYEAYERAEYGKEEDRINYEARLYIHQDPPDYWMGKKLNKTYEKEKALREAVKELEQELAGK